VRFSITTRGTLHALDVPVVAIVDFDALREEGRVRGIVEALGQDWSRFTRDWTIINAAVQDMSAAPDIVDAKETTSAAYDEAAARGPRLTREASDKIRAANQG